MTNLSHRLHASAAQAAASVLFCLPLAGDPVVLEVIAPEIHTNRFGNSNIEFTVRFGLQEPTDNPIFEGSFQPENVRVTITDAENPTYQDAVLQPLFPNVSIEEDQTLLVTYSFWLPDFAELGPQFAGTYTAELLPEQVYSQDQSPEPVKTYVPAQTLATFDVGLTPPPYITIRGRLWLETGTPSLIDDQPEVDPGIEEWNMSVQVKFSEDVWDDVFVIAETDSLGFYSVQNLLPGEYRIGPMDLIPEIATQAVGDPSRDGVKDGWMYVTLTAEQDGETVIVNFSYMEKEGPPFANHDEYTILSGSSELTFPVLDNDEGEGLTITGLSDYQTTVDFGGRSSFSTRQTPIRTNGSVIYYTPWPGGGWDLFWYKVEDANGNIDLTRVWVFQTPFYPFPLEAYPDVKYMGIEQPHLDVDVLENDIILTPHSLSSVSVETDSISDAGGSLEVVGTVVRYTPPMGFLGEDTFSYTLESEGSNSTASVTITVTEVESTVPPRVNGLSKTLENILSVYPQGRYYIALLQKHLPEIVIIAGNVNGSPAARFTRDNPATQFILDAFLDPYVEGFSQVIAGNGDSTEVTQLMATSTELFLNTLEVEGSPALRADLLRERQAVGGLQQFVGRNFNEVMTELTSFDPADLTVPVANTSIDPEGVHLTVYNAIGQVFRLWKASNPNAADWVEVEQSAEPAETTFYRLTDPQPGDGHAFYRVSAALEQDIAAR